MPSRRRYTDGSYCASVDLVAGPQPKVCRLQCTGMHPKNPIYCCVAFHHGMRRFRLILPGQDIRSHRRVRFVVNPYLRRLSLVDTYELPCFVGVCKRSGRLCSGATAPPESKAGLSSPCRFVTDTMEPLRFRNHEITSHLSPP